MVLGEIFGIVWCLKKIKLYKANINASIALEHFVGGEGFEDIAN
jgi:hypothetical protein